MNRHERANAQISVTDSTTGNNATKGAADVCEPDRPTAPGRSRRHGADASPHVSSNRDGVAARTPRPRLVSMPMSPQVGMASRDDD